MATRKHPTQSESDAAERAEERAEAKAEDRAEERAAVRQAERTRIGTRADTGGPPLEGGEGGQVQDPTVIPTMEEAVEATTMAPNPDQPPPTSVEIPDLGVPHDEDGRPMNTAPLEPTSDEKAALNWTAGEAPVGDGSPVADPMQNINKNVRNHGYEEAAGEPSPPEADPMFRAPGAEPEPNALVQAPGEPAPRHRNLIAEGIGPTVFPRANEVRQPPGVTKDPYASNGNVSPSDEETARHA